MVATSSSYVAYWSRTQLRRSQRRHSQLCYAMALHKLQAMVQPTPADAVVADDLEHFRAALYVAQPSSPLLPCQGCGLVNVVVQHSCASGLSGSPQVLPTPFRQACSGSGVSDLVAEIPPGGCGADPDDSDLALCADLSVEADGSAVPGDSDCAHCADLPAEGSGHRDNAKEDLRALESSLLSVPSPSLEPRLPRRVQQPETLPLQAMTTACPPKPPPGAFPSDAIVVPPQLLEGNKKKKKTKKRKHCNVCRDSWVTGLPPCRCIELEVAGIQIPEEPLTAYHSFVEERAAVASAETSMVDLAKQIASEWTALTPQQKDQFLQASLQLADTYREEMVAAHRRLTQHVAELTGASSSTAKYVTG